VSGFKNTVKTISVLALGLIIAFGVYSEDQFAFASEQPSIHQQVISLASEKNFEAALSLLARQDINTQNSYSHRLLQGRILSWDGQYSRAQHVFDKLNHDFPQNADVLVATGSLEYYQGDLDKAEQTFLSVLALNPHYTDAKTGLENVSKAKAENRPYKWRIDGGTGLSTFDESNLDDWNNQYLRAEYAPGDVAYHVRANRYKRFGEKNVQFEGGIASANRGDWDWGVAAGFTPDAIFRPKTHYSGRVGRKFELETGPTVVATLHYRRDNYTEAKIHNISPEVTAYFQNGARLTGRLINTIQSEEKNQTGWLVNGSYPVTAKWKLNGGVARAPEAVDGIVITTKSLFGGVSYAVSSKLDLHINIARDNRENTYKRNAVNVGFTQKY